MRGLIVVVLVIGGWFGWIVRSARIQSEAVAAIERAGGFASYDWEWKDGLPVANGARHAPRWFVDRIGVDYFGTVVRVYCNAYSRLSDDVMSQIGRLTDLEELVLPASVCTDSGLAKLQALSRLQILNSAKRRSPMQDWRE